MIDKSPQLLLQTKAEFISYQQTGYFTKIVADYLSANNSIQSFYQHPFTLDGIKAAIFERNKFNTNRKLLVDALEQQYADINTSEKVKQNIKALLSEKTYTICTAHQPNIFTGHLYFIYKIIHTIKLAEKLTNELPDNIFVPVFYMGSEDADIEELGEVTINGEKYEWQTKQTGAVGRMIVDEALLKILKKIKGELLVEPFGEEIINLLENCYTKGTTIQDACFALINNLFAKFGLVVLLPDNAILKKEMLAVFEDDIFNNTPYKTVTKTAEKFSEHYKVQAQPREINLFYLRDNIRNRIIAEKKVYKVNDTGIQFTPEELKKELNEYPERFSPNVILRAIYQETILPNIIFVGGGGELAYWLELKDLFHQNNVPYPVLILRNSFLLIDKKINALINKLSFSYIDIFKNETELVNDIVSKNSGHKLSLEKEKDQLAKLYQNIKIPVKEVDETLLKHVESLLAKALHRLQLLEKKLLKAEKKKFEVEQQQVKKIRSVLFPKNQLQERVENFMPFYAKHGKEFIHILYENSLHIEQEFCILAEEDKLS